MNADQYQTGMLVTCLIDAERVTGTNGPHLVTGAIVNRPIVACAYRHIIPIVTHDATGDAIIVYISDDSIIDVQPNPDGSYFP